MGRSVGGLPLTRLQDQVDKTVPERVIDVIDQDQAVVDPVGVQQGGVELGMEIGEKCLEECLVHLTPVLVASAILAVEPDQFIQGVARMLVAGSPALLVPGLRPPEKELLQE